MVLLITQLQQNANPQISTSKTLKFYVTQPSWCPWRESDPRPLPYQGSALPLSHMGINFACSIVWSGRRDSNSRHSVWKTEALPTELHPRTHLNQRHQAQTISSYYIVTKTGTTIWWRGKDSNLRTLRERIYSPSPLTTRPPLQTEPTIMLIIWLAVKLHKRVFDKKLVPDVGIELTTFALQVRCSTNWANPAFIWVAYYTDFLKKVKLFNDS